MKKLLTTIAILISLSATAQDSTRITLSVGARDLEYIAAFIFNDDAVEDLYDTIKLKFRVQNPPTNLQAVSITAYTFEWVIVYIQLNNDATALKTNCASRMEALLRAVNQPYLTGRINEIQAAYISTAIAHRQFGRAKLRRQ